ncbi:MAG: transglutaminase domain-containing protein, partial [SAR202 cluster bacterium]|nr:transglutaminase domain-containing protein [SAR202 cluster bacterium]
LGGMWILGFFSAFALFRRNNFWVLVVLGGTSLFTHVSFLPEELSLSFFVFMFFAVLLIARMTFLQREKEWKAGEVSVGPLSGLLSLNWGVALAASVLIIAALLPMEPWVSRFVARTWNNARAPVVTLQDGFSRLVTGVDSKRNLPGRLFGNNLPFLGSIRFNGEVVFWADTEYASYWLSRTYSEYTAKGWIAGDTIELKVGPDTVFPTPGDSRKRTPVPQRLQVMFNTQGLLAGGDLEWLSRNAVLETLAPMEFVVTLADASADAEFPADIQTVAQDIRAELNGTPNPFIESAVASVLPNDLVVTSIGYKGAAADREPVEVTLRRKDPVTPEIVSFRFDDDLLKEEVYAMVSLVSTATDEDLRHAGTGYSNTIKDHYLQLPSTLPQRVRDLALQITAGAATPLDKARAIEAYLRGPGFTYSQTIDKPPDGADGVDYFLFETRTGYSDYFASSMTVLLRAVGVPARMAAGFAPGEINAQTGLLAVRDTDSHGWVQVYFPAYGWIDFEPTPAWPEHERVMGLPSSGVPGGLLDGGTIES